MQEFHEPGTMKEVATSERQTHFSETAEPGKRAVGGLLQIINVTCATLKEK
jgi:hypothetical protein